MSKILTYFFTANHGNNFSDPFCPKSRKLVIWHLDDDPPVCSPRVPPGSSGLISPRIRQSFVENLTKTWKSNMADNPHVDWKLEISARQKVELNWIYISLNLNKIGKTEPFRSAFLSTNKVTVENFDFCVAAPALSSAVRHVDRLVLTAGMGPWEGAQFSAPAVESGDFLRFALRNSKFW